MATHPIKIDVLIDASDPVQLKAALTFLAALGEVDTPKGGDVKTEKPDNSSTGNEKQAEAKSDWSKEDVRAAVQKKASKFRKEIKAKLTELNANNVSELDEKHYGTMMDFLNSL